MSMKTITRIHSKQGYIETEYICNNCGVVIQKIREHAGELFISDWSKIPKCACGATLVREVKQFVPDVSESNIIEVDGDEKE